MLYEEVEEFFILAEVGFDSFSFGDVLDGAAHDGGAASLIEFESATAMNPVAERGPLARTIRYSLSKLECSWTAPEK